MRINIVCQECSRQNNNWAVFYIDQIRDDGVYIGKCPKGHSNAVAAQTLRHEMLFEIGLNAIKDCYYREAVSSFASSVERYNEFAIRVICCHNKIPDYLVKQTWSEVAVQTERQLGAYLFLYVATFGQSAPTLPKPMTTLRNSIIHKGTLPDRKQAIEFGEASYIAIQTGVRKLRDECIDDVNSELTARMRQVIEKYGDKFPRSTQVTPTALNVIQDIKGGFVPFSQVLASRGISID